MFQLEVRDVGYKQAGDSVGTIGSQVNQAQALQTLGLYRQARKLLVQIRQTLDIPYRSHSRECIT